MSARTAQASKAIRLAWNQEKELVLEGKGTRDWTPKQQQDILDKGRAYDESGRAFEGHHMKSVSAYPEFQGEPDNIQFLSRDEHVKAHFDDVHNPTNGYFNPITGATTDFGDNPPKPCNIVHLSEPISKQNTVIKHDATNETTEKNATKKESEKQKQVPETPKDSGNNLTQVAAKVVNVYKKYAPIIKPVAKAAGMVLGSYAIGKISGGGKNSNRKVSSEGEVSYGQGKSVAATISDAVKNVSDSYTPNDVPAGKQRYHYKDGSVKWVDKPAYHRSGNKVE